MSASKESDAGFPWFEEQNFTGWLVQFRAHLRKAGAHVVLDRPRPSDLDAQGNHIPMTAKQRRTFNDEVAEYDRLDNIAFSELMKACRQNVKVKNLSETGEFNTAYELLQRLRPRYYTVDDITKAEHMLNYHDELREYLALRVWVSRLMTLFVGQSSSSRIPPTQSTNNWPRPFLQNPI